MDTSYSWHSRTGRVVSRWAIPVSLLPDELFSSWLVRAALVQGCDPLTLTGEVWPKWRIWTMDPDRGLIEERLSPLAKVSGIEVSAFRAASLLPIGSAVVSGSLDNLAMWPWILALGSRNRKRHGGLQYCPACLREDVKPYYRVQWRLVWHIGCAKHGVSLSDKCPHCNAPIEPHRLSGADCDMAICATCKRDLRDSKSMKADADALAFQQVADQVARHKQGKYGTNSLPSSELFALSRYFVMLLRKVALGKSEALIALTKMLGVDTEAMRPPATGLALELLPVQERAMLLVGVWQILRAGPERFLEAAKAASLAAPSLRECNQEVPRCIHAIIHDLPDKSASKRRRGQSNILKPRSRQAVMHMWARLQRRMRVETR